eukprot:TRINITY_DN2274_c0_g1_i2.p1 TRINITY_DN2274_c0_g1~~TRINITY_DN2274_c0_g1_i2.p1  ORF type:complete len:258 (+),score=78.04 TRINITY_DN2274_c0_g1_i2:41-775(+)
MAADDSSQYTPAAVAWTRGTLRLSFDAPLPVSLSTGAAVRVQVALRNEEGYFGVEWDSSVALARYLVASPQLVSGKHVLELGAGVGSLSALSSLLGASQVVATDLEGMMPLMRRTMRANGIACADSTAADDGNDAHAMVAPYKWGDPMAQFSLPFDIVLASDVLFDPAEWTALVDSFTASGAAMVLLAHRTRNAQERLFFDEWLRGAFTWRRLDSGASTAGSGGMELFELTRRAEHSSPPQRAW